VIVRKNGKGCLIIIGGHESKGQRAERPILELVASRVSPKGRLALVTVASQEPEALAAEYTRVFNELGVKHVDHLDIRRRADAETERAVETIKNAR
jgi:cyanophycinase